jgi:hypothetical protein
MGATHNSKASMDGSGPLAIVEHNVPTIRVDNDLVEAINGGFKLAGTYVRQGEVSQTVENSTAQYASNSRCTGRVVLKIPNRASSVQVDLLSYWPSWHEDKDSKGKAVRIYSKNHGSKIITLMQTGSFANPVMQALEHIAYCTLGVIKARINSPREGLIKANVLEALESSGILVEGGNYRGEEFTREGMLTKVATMRQIFDAMQSVGQFQAIEKRGAAYQVNVLGQ